MSESKLIVEENDEGFTLYQKRIKICDTCEYKSQIGICTKCGCVLAIKARIPIFKCPIDKW